MILAVLQARTSSSRLPGKILLPILGGPMLARQIERVRRSKKIDKLVIATSIEKSDDAVEALCRELGVDCFRGSLENVLDRFASAVRLYKPAHVVRLTGDCPLIDPAVIDRVIDAHVAGGFDYTSNTQPPTFPDGMDVEIMTAEALETACRQAHLPSDREHVTPFLYRHEGLFQLGQVRHSHDLSAVRLTVDTEDDYRLAVKIYETLYLKKNAFTMEDVLSTLQKNPSWGMLGRQGVRNEGYLRSLEKDEPDWKTYEHLYEAVYGPLTERLSKPPARILYRGVDILWCYKFILFEDAHYALLTGELPADLPPVHAERSLKQFWPSTIAWGKLRRARVAVFADSGKAKNVLARLEGSRTCLFSHGRAPRVFWRAFREKRPFFQAGTQSSAFKRRQAAKLFERYKRDTILADLRFDGREAVSLLEGSVRRLFLKELPALLSFVDGAHAFFSKAPSLGSVLLDEDVSAAKSAFCQVARQYHVKTFVECHGALGGKIGFLPLSADTFLSWGREGKKKLASWGCPEDRVTAAGSSRYAAYASLDAAEAKAKMAAVYGLDASKPIILFAPHPLDTPKFVFNHTVRKTTEWALDVLASFPSAQFLIKLHPGETNPGFYDSWKAPHVKIVQYADSLALARGADLLIVHNSTFAADGFALGKNVITLRDKLRSSVEEFDRYGVFREASGAEELRAALESALADGSLPARSAEAARECLNADEGDPAKTIASLLESARPLVSVVLAVHNGERYLEEQVRSILDQTHRQIELICVDDASTDSSAEILEKFAEDDPRVSVHRNERNLGIVRNFLKGASLAKGDFVAFSDQDDVWVRDKISTLTALVGVSPVNMLAYSDLEVCDASLKPLTGFWQASGHRGVRPDVGEKALLRNVAPGCAMLFRREVADALADAYANQMFMEKNGAVRLDDTPFMHDQLAFFFAAGLGRIIATSKKLVRYRQHAANNIGAYYPAVDDKERFFRATAAKLQLLRESRLVNGAPALARLDRFLSGRRQAGLAERLSYLPYYFFIRNDRFRDKALAALEAVSPGLYDNLKRTRRK